MQYLLSGVTVGSDKSFVGVLIVQNNHPTNESPAVLPPSSVDPLMKVAAQLPKGLYYCTLKVI